MHASNAVIKSALWMLVAITSFSFMAISAREISSDLNTYHILFYRSLFGLVLLSFIFSLKGWSNLQCNNFKLHLTRNISHFIGQYAWFYAIAFIPLSHVFALEFTVPFWTAIAAYILLNEEITRYKIIAIIFGLIGVIIILRPGLTSVHPAAIAMLAGAASYGIAHTLTRKLALKTNVLTILFFMSLLQLLFSTIPVIIDWQNLHARTFNYLLLITLCGLIAHYSLSKALTYSEATIVLPMDFLRLPLIIVLAYILYQESVDMFLIVGALIMLAGNMINILYSTNRK